MRIVAILSVVVLLLAGAWIAFGQTAVAPTSPCTAAAHEPAPSTGPIDESATVSWQEGWVPEQLRGLGEQFLNDVAWFSGGFTAIGVSRLEGRSHSVLLTSTDGLEWRADPTDPVRFADTELWRLAVAGGRLFALGSSSTDDRGGSRAAIWSTDGSTGWSEATGPFDETTPIGIAAGPDGLLMIGSRNSDGTPVVWNSDDAMSWEEGALDLPVPRHAASFGAIAAVDDGWHAAGSIGGAVDGPRAAVIWRSGDGVSWSCQVLDAAGYGVASVHELHRSGARWLATGMLGEPCSDTGQCLGYGVTWTSDGLSWSEAQTSVPPAVGGTAVLGGDTGYVAVRGDATAISSDGFAWTIVDGGGPGSQPEGIAAADDGVVVVVGADHLEGGDVNGWLSVGEVDR
jgi:hypothetical protein